MDLGKLRRGELIAAAGGIVLLIAMFAFDWYTRESFVFFSGTTNVGAWDDLGLLGAIANLIILSAALAALALAFIAVTSRTVALPVAASALTAALGIAAVAMVLLRMLFQPGPNAVTDLKFGIVLALLGALIVAYGGWQSMKEEGTTFEAARDQLQARYARRPAPEPRTTPEDAREDTSDETSDDTSETSEAAEAAEAASETVSAPGELEPPESQPPPQP
jgi:ABC-type multidrug transport system fused ATPase/permease subunit